MQEVPPGDPEDVLSLDEQVEILASMYPERNLEGAGDVWRIDLFPNVGGDARKEFMFCTVEYDRSRRHCQKSLEQEEVEQLLVKEVQEHEEVAVVKEQPVAKQKDGGESHGLQDTTSSTQAEGSSNGTGSHGKGKKGRSKGKRKGKHASAEDVSAETQLQERPHEQPRRGDDQTSDIAVDEASSSSAKGNKKGKGRGKKGEGKKGGEREEGKKGGGKHSKGRKKGKAGVDEVEVYVEPQEVVQKQQHQQQESPKSSAQNHHIKWRVKEPTGGKNKPDEGPARSPTTTTFSPASRLKTGNHQHVVLRPRTTPQLRPPSCWRVVKSANLGEHELKKLLDRLDNLNLDLEEAGQGHVSPTAASTAGGVVSNMPFVDGVTSGIDFLTELNEQLGGDCPVCSFPLDGPDVYGDTGPLYRPIACFHAMHRSCVIGYWKAAEGERFCPVCRKAATHEDLLELHVEIEQEDGRDGSSSRNQHPRGPQNESASSSTTGAFNNTDNYYNETSGGSSSSSSSLRFQVSTDAGFKPAFERFRDGFGKELSDSQYYRPKNGAAYAIFTFRSQDKALRAMLNLRNRAVPLGDIQESTIQDSPRDEDPPTKKDEKPTWKISYYFPPIS
ncbi:unnamed protein product [Amoebophrya sp. A25]|nr:unnamed protein product [Amoebophrya sp. A25]|eukprot:GSA25T00015414001.1